MDLIRPQVAKDFAFNQALNLARRAGTDFYHTLTNGLAQGKTPAALCAEAKVQLVDLPPFSLSTRELPQVEDHLTLNQFKQIVFSTAVGKVSPFQMTSEGGVIVYVKAKLPLDEAKMNATLPAFANSVRQSRKTRPLTIGSASKPRSACARCPLARPQTPPELRSAPKAKKSEAVRDANRLPA